MKWLNVLMNVLIVQIVLMVLFGMYASFVAPDLTPPDSITETVSENPNSTPAYLSDLQEYFPADSWVLNIQNYQICGDDYILIFDGFDGRDERCLQSKRFAALFFLKGSQNGARPVIITGEDQVKIYLAGAVSDKKMSLNDFVQGDFHGPIKILWPGEKGDGSDAFCLETSNVIYENQTLKSDFPVTFHFLSHTARGTAFSASLDFVNNSSGKINFKGIREFELTQLDSLQLCMTREDFARRSKVGSQSDQELDRYFGGKDIIPVQVSCEGPVSFQNQNMQISFQKNVRLEALYPALPHDTITCDNLILSFITQPAKEDKIPQIVLEQISAISQVTPLKIQSPSQNLTASGRKCDLNLLTSTFSFSDQIAESTIQLKDFEFHAKFIDCTLPVSSEGSPSLPTVNVDGSGWLRYQSENDRGEIQSTRVNWRESLQIHPDVQNEYAILLHGDVTLNSPEFGSISAPQLYLWLKKKTPEHLAWEKSMAAAQPSRSPRDENVSALFQEYYPARLDVDRRTGSTGGDAVKFCFTKENITFTGTLDKINVWFAPMMSIPEALRLFPASDGSTASPFTSGDKKLPQTYRITAGHLNAHLLLPYDSHQMPFCTRLELSDGIQIIEEPGYQSSDLPVHIAGTHVLMTDLTLETLEATITGEPALLSARGMEVRGSTISINNKCDRLWMNKGQMKCLCVLKGKPEIIGFQWDDHMEFRGKNIDPGDSEPRGKVIIKGNSSMVQSTHQISNRNQLAAKFAIPFDFSAPPRLDNMTQANLPEILTNVTAYGETVFRSQIKDDRNEQTYILNAVLKSQLEYDPRQNVVQSNSEGWANITFPEQVLQMSDFSPNSGRESVEVEASEDGSSLFQMDIRFCKGFYGNLDKREFTFLKDIHIVGNHVPTWDSRLDPDIDPFNLAPKGFILTCEEITMNQIPKIVPSTVSRKPLAEMDFEFLAKTQVSVEMPSISAHGDHLKYSSEKSLITLEGNPATVTYQGNIGSKSSMAKYPSIRINTKTHTFTGEMNSVQGGGL